MFKNFTLYLGAFIGAAIMGFLWWATYPGKPVPGHLDKNAPAQVLVGGVHVLERTTSPTPAQAPQVLPTPTGFKATRAARFQIQPDTPKIPGDAPLPVDVSLAVVANSKGEQRVEVKADNGTILGGVDVPLVGPQIAMEHPWALGAVWTPQDRTWGIVGLRTWRRLAVEAQIRGQREPIQAGGRVDLRADVSVLFRFGTP